MGTEGGKPKHETDLIDLAWDDDASGEISIPDLTGVPDLGPSAFDRVTAVPDEPDYAKQAMALADDKEERSGVQPREDRDAASPGFELAGLELDDPGEPHGVDDLRLDLSSPKAPDLMQLGAPPSALELDLETPMAPEVEEPAESKMRDRYAAGDFTGALVLAESLLESNPSHADALRFAESCRDVLLQMYSARLGSLDRPVYVAVPPDQVRWLSLDHRSGFLLSLIDGSSTIEELLDISGMPRLEALRIVYTLFEQQVIGLGTDVASH
ncbi:MAG: hypothetical protein HYZ29_08295 [Myxococcales bacterium]|nr:hypothetical protein [Myxococcales bacterium]